MTEKITTEEQKTLAAVFVVIATSLRFKDMTVEDTLKELSDNGFKYEDIIKKFL